jgi:hypothetical protein
LIAPEGQNILFFKDNLRAISTKFKTEFWKTYANQLSVNLIQNLP